MRLPKACYNIRDRLGVARRAMALCYQSYGTNDQTLSLENLSHMVRDEDDQRGSDSTPHRTDCRQVWIKTYGGDPTHDHRNTTS